jgi:hypothetical protein
MAKMKKAIPFEIEREMFLEKIDRLEKRVLALGEIRVMLGDAVKKAHAVLLDSGGRKRALEILEDAIKAEILHEQAQARRE